MSNLLLDGLNLKILRYITNNNADNGIEINYTNISEELNKHRITIKRRIDELLEKKIIDYPICYPYGLLYKKYPLFIAVYADLPPEAEEWMKKDEKIFAAFRIIDDRWNTLLLEFHETVLEYQKWREELTKSKKIPPRIGREPSISYYLSNELLIKNDTSVVIKLLEEDILNKVKLVINDKELDVTDFDILKCLVSDTPDKKFFKINEYKLSSKLNVHRKTIEKRINKMMEQKLITPPRCFFPNYFAPTGYYIVFSLIEVRDQVDNFITQLEDDYHVPIVFKTSTEKYNIVKFSVHKSMDMHLGWTENMRRNFRAQKSNYLSQNSVIFINGEKIWNHILDKELEKLKENEQVINK